MAEIVLGSRAKSLEVILTKDADFFTTLTTEDGSDWPVGAEIKLVLEDNEFSAVITGPDASFTIDYIIVNQLIAARVISAKLFYIEGSSEICWGVGQVNANG